MEEVRTLTYAGERISDHASRIMRRFDSDTESDATVSILGLLETEDVEAIERVSGVLTALLILGHGNGLEERTVNMMARVVEFLAPIADDIRRVTNGENNG